MARSGKCSHVSGWCHPAVFLLRMNRDFLPAPRRRSETGCCFPTAGFLPLRSRLLRKTRSDTSHKQPDKNHNGEQCRSQKRLAYLTRFTRNFTADNISATHLCSAEALLRLLLSWSENPPKEPRDRDVSHMPSPARSSKIGAQLQSRNFVSQIRNGHVQTALRQRIHPGPDAAFGLQNERASR